MIMGKSGKPSSVRQIGAARDARTRRSISSSAIMHSASDPLERVVPARPAVEQAALDHEHVEKHDDRRRPRHAAEPIRRPTRTPASALSRYSASSRA